MLTKHPLFVRTAFSLAALLHTRLPAYLQMLGKIMCTQPKDVLFSQVLHWDTAETGSAGTAEVHCHAMQYTDCTKGSFHHNMLISLRCWSAVSGIQWHLFDWHLCCCGAGGQQTPNKGNLGAALLRRFNSGATQEPPRRSICRSGSATMPTSQDQHTQAGNSNKR